MDTLHKGHGHKEFERLIANRLQRPSGLESNQVYRIPVVVHVVHNNSTTEVGLGNNISDEQIWSAIEVLNEDFKRLNADTILTPSWARPVAANLQIEFILASQDPNGNFTNGITRHKVTQASYAFTSADEKVLKANGYWPSDQYLNIWVASLTGGVIGYAQFPDQSTLLGIDNQNGTDKTDGIVIAPFAFGRLTGKANGSNNPYKLGRTVVHEIGHWLGLLHVFNDFGNGCNYTDYCNDTPTQNLSSSGLSACDTTIFSSCGTKTMFSNYMDYSNDACMNLFTKDQKSRVHTVMEISPRRQALQYSKGACGTTGKIELPYAQTFADSIALVKQWVLTTTSKEHSWSFKNEVLVAKTKVTPKDSLVLKSPVITYEKTQRLKLRFDLTSQLKQVDSIKVYYEMSCSGKLKLLKMIELSESGFREYLVDVNNINQNGLMALYFVVYSNGNTFELDNIKLYNETSEMQVSIFPNPSTNGDFEYLLGLPSEQDLHVSVYDLRGTLMYDSNEKQYSGYYPLDLRSLVSGLYFVKFISEDQNKTIKVLIE